MEIRKILTLRGPNFWSRYPVIEAWVDLKELKDSPSDTLPGFNDRLMAWLPTMIEHRCSIGERGGFFQRLRDGTWPGHILEHVTIELQTLAGTPVGFGKARETSEEGVYKVVVRYRDEHLGRACLLAGRELVMAAIYDKPYDVAAEIAKLQNLADRVCLGPSTSAIVKAAEARDIPARRLNSGSLVQLGQGIRQRRIWTAETDRTSAIAESIAQDKELTKTLLRAGGIPVPEGRIVNDAADAWEAAMDTGLPVVVKPRDGNHGRGVITNLTTRPQVEAAFHVAQKEGTGVIVEKFAPGNEHRLFVVGNRMIAAARGDVAQIEGDGARTVKQLVEDQLNSDPRRGEGDAFPLSPIEFDPVTVLQLEQQGYGVDSVPPGGTTVLVQRNGNLAIDVTDQVHPSIAAHAVLAAQIVGLDVAGLDIVVEDISQPLESQGGVIVEVNSSPGLHMHLRPSVGTPRPVGEAIVDSLFPPGQNGRIPVVCITGTNGKTTVTRLISRMLRATGRVVGTATTDGIVIDQRTIESADCAGPRSARKILMSPLVEAGVFEAARGGILREGLGFDKCDVAVVTNVADGDHLGQSYIDDLEQMAIVKRSAVDVILPEGTVVLKADDPLVAEMAAECKGTVTLFALDGGHPVMAAHREQGKRTVFVRDGEITLAEGTNETPLVDVARVPLTFGGRVAFHVENVLAAAAAAWGLGIPNETIRTELETFQSDAATNPGRFNVLEHRGATVIIDDSHNTSALSALIAAIDKFPGDRRTAVYSSGDGRRDADIIRQGAQLGAAFDRVILYEDYSASDREPGELASLFRQGLAGAARAAEVLEIPSHRQAIETALSLVGAGELLVIQPEDEDIQQTLETVRVLTAREATEESGCFLGTDRN
jgi:cyanophycin synthetase